MTILTPSLQSWVYPALHSKKGKGLRFPNSEKAPKHRQSRKVLPEGASAALADLKYCDRGRFMVTVLDHLEPALQPALTPAVGTACVSLKAEAPLLPPQPPDSNNSHELPHTQHGDSGAAVLGPLPVHPWQQGFLAERLWDVSATGSRLHRQPVGIGMWTLQGNRPPRGILGLWQPSWTALEWGGG